MRGRRDPSSIGLGIALGVGALVYQLAFPPTLNFADESFTLYGAKRVLQGQAPYRDFFDFITPLGFYYFALAYRVGGTTITSAKVAMALAGATSAVCTFAVARLVASPAEALLAAVVFVAAGYPVWPMASPHWLSTTFGLATAIALLAPCWRDSQRLRPAVAGIIAGLAVGTQQQRGTLLALWLAIAILVTARHAGRQRMLREIGWAAAAGAATVGAVLGVSIWRSSLADVFYATVAFVLTSYRGYHVGKVSWGGSGPLGAAGQAAALPGLAALIPVTTLLEGLGLAWAARRGWGQAEDRRAVLALLAVLMAVSVLYFPDFIHLAFVMPFGLVVAAGILSRARHHGWLRSHRLARAGGVAVLALLFAGAAWKGERNLSRFRAQVPERFDSGFGVLAGTPDTRRLLGYAMDALHPADHPVRLYSYPSDAWLYLALPADNPFPFALLRQGYSAPEQVAQVVAAIERGVPDYVLVNLFFTTPDDPVVAAVRAHYQPIAGLSFVHVLYGRKPG